MFEISNSCYLAYLQFEFLKICCQGNIIVAHFRSLIHFDGLKINRIELLHHYNTTHIYWHFEVITMIIYILSVQH